MRPKKRNTSSGVITFHVPLKVSQLRSEERAADVKDASEKRSSSSSRRPSGPHSYATAGTGEEASPPPGPRRGPRQDQNSSTSLRQVQAKVSADNQQKREIIQPLLDTENGFMKELDRFLMQRGVAELRRRELLHRRWTERVWTPVQRRVERRASGRGLEDAALRQTLHAHYLQHCNSKGFVFLDTSDLREYNPFLLHVKKSSFLKPNTAECKEFYLQMQERLKATRTARSCFCETGRKSTSRRAEDPPQSEPATPGAVVQSQASSPRRVPATKHTPVQEERKSSRLDSMPCSICSTSDMRCHRSGCWFSKDFRHQCSSTYQ